MHNTQSDEGPVIVKLTADPKLLSSHGKVDSNNAPFPVIPESAPFLVDDLGQNDKQGASEQREQPLQHSNDLEPAQSTVEERVSLSPPMQMTKAASLDAGPANETSSKLEFR